jgi:hypothetical protein
MSYPKNPPVLGFCRLVVISNIIDLAPNSTLTDLIFASHKHN